MHTLMICLFIATWMAILSKLPLAYAMQKSGHYDNAHPREQQKKLKGFGARALAAHQNSFEALLVFGLAVFAVAVSGQVSWWAKCYAITFVVARLAYHVVYLLNWATVRSLVWFIGFYCSIAMMGLTVW